MERVSLVISKKLYCNDTRNRVLTFYFHTITCKRIQPMNDGSAVTRISNVPTMQRAYVKVVVQVHLCVCDFGLVFDDAPQPNALRESDTRAVDVRTKFHLSTIRSLKIFGCASVFENQSPSNRCVFSEDISFSVYKR